MCVYIFETENRLLHKHLHPYLDQFLNRIKSHFVHDFYLDFQTVKVKTLLQVKNIGRENRHSQIGIISIVIYGGYLTIQCRHV